MTVISTDKDEKNLVFTIVAEFDAQVERVWQIWADPRMLELWWATNTSPTTFETHEFEPGGVAHYYMLGSHGQKVRGRWSITAIDAPRTLSFDDGFADDNWEPIEDMGTAHAFVVLMDIDGRTRMTTTMTFDTAEQMQPMAEMKMDEDLVRAMCQIDGILVGPAAS
ncbi:SRPBCC domain-containing protein [Rhodococcus sp. H29-C3]|uniref:SRPBCC family protein n=1 Tax=Rhodococcus sp. H29-C3 TaxID=3046307 RepID=UPI0024B9DE15|nr:SRPBCC domain-containing protein [Rhodococcus sp. H29-C3]MDJ0362364.1 SRPBCC domain-containing protein [Rhodococcus sp. H29-C3]